MVVEPSCGLRTGTTQPVSSKRNGMVNQYATGYRGF